MAKKPKMKCDLSQNWAKATFIPEDGEYIIYSDLNKIKIGDGKTSITDLPFTEDLKNLYQGNFYYQ